MVAHGSLDGVALLLQPKSDDGLGPTNTGLKLKTVSA